MKRLSTTTNLFIASNVIKCSKDARYTCFYCKLEFPCEGSLSAHLTTLQHLGSPDKKFHKNPEFICMLCGSDVPLNSVTKHLCVDKAYKNYWELVNFIDEFGSPNMCLLCRGEVFETPAHLNAHILISHNWKDFDSDQKMKQPTQAKQISSDVLRCPICLSIFKTKDAMVLHRHVFDDHTPEIGITMLNCLSGFSRAKYGSANDLKQWVSKRIYACNFPNFRVKRYPVNTFAHINRFFPSFSSRSCTETFASLFTLSSHLCTFHIVDEITKVQPNDTKITMNLIRLENEKRLNIVQQEIDLRRRNLLSKKIIIDKILASTYCLECFRVYETNFALQIHFMVSHLNMCWNICGICSYDCKLSLGLTDQIEDVETSERSSILLWNALWNHEKCHLLFFEELEKNPLMKITQNCLLEMPNDANKLLEQPRSISSRESNITNILKISKPAFNLDQIAILMDLGTKNTRNQTEFMINEALNE